MVSLFLLTLFPEDDNDFSSIGSGSSDNSVDLRRVPPIPPRQLAKVRRESKEQPYSGNKKPEPVNKKPEPVNKKPDSVKIDVPDSGRTKDKEECRRSNKKAVSEAVEKVCKLVRLG